MHALILAGGFATRLWPITKDFPKPLLSLGGKRIIEFVIEGVNMLDNIRRIYISTNKAFEKTFRRWLEHSEYAKPKSMFKLIVEPTTEEEEKFGAIRGIHYDISFMLDENFMDDLLIVAGDNVTSLNFKSFASFYEKVRSPVVAVYEVESLEAMKKLAEIHIDDSNRITSFIEKPQKPKSRLAATAIYIIPRDMVNLIDTYLKEGRNPDAPGYFFEWLSKKYDVYAYKFSGYWFDIGSLTGYLSALKSLLTRSYISPRANVHGKIVDPVYIGDGAEVDSDSRIGPYVIVEENVKIRNAIVESSLLMRHSKIYDSEIYDSMIGSKSNVVGGKIVRSILSSHTKLSIIRE